MPLSSHLLRKLRDTLGAEAADDLSAILDAMEGDRGDIREIRHDLQPLRAHIDARFDQHAARMEALLEKGLRQQTQFFFVAWAVILAAIIGLYAR